MTSMFALGNENPADTSIDAGLTTPANYRGVAGAHRPPVDAALSSTGGVALPIPIVGAVLALAGLTCLVVSRRRRSI
jgi:hypothetical protein